MRTVKIIDNQRDKEYDFRSLKDAAEWLKVTPQNLTYYTKGKGLVKHSKVHKRYSVSIDFEDLI